MLTLDLEPAQDGRLVFVQEEPALEIALPQIFDQPELTTLQRGKLAHVEALVAKIYRSAQAHPQAGLGADYQELVTEFAPLFAWAIACWDYLLSTEGCRFVLRNNGEQKGGVLRLGSGRRPERSRMGGARGDYRVVTDKDYSRMVHGIFRGCVLAFAQSPEASSLRAWLRPRFWPLVLEAYRRLEQPPDPRQRTLTPYSYLRCIPYEFLNDYHHELVYSTVQQLPAQERGAIDAYFFHFLTEASASEALGRSLEETLAMLRQGLIKLLINHRLVYCLLRQIERY